jgi:16S rRNA C967 or C1407 C5-methylase (RsmB/RsmF family)
MKMWHGAAQASICQHVHLLRSTPLFHAGTYYVQEASSMFIEQVWKTIVADDKELRVLDMCAAPGGKSTHLLSLLKEDSLLVSNEMIPNRNAVLRENITKWGMLTAL